LSFKHAIRLVRRFVMRPKSVVAAVGLVAGVCVGLIGCSKSSSTAPKTAESAAPEIPHGHHHHEAGPHGGQVIGLDTADYHAEVTQDAATHRVGVYILDAYAAGVAPAKAASVTIEAATDGTPTEYALPAVAQPEDTEGTSSYFELESEPLFDAVIGADSAAGRPELKLVIDGKSFVGDIPQPTQSHAVGHGHSHGGDDALVWRQELKEEGYEIALGHHGVTLLAGGTVEPALQLTRGGEPVADAQVFTTLLDSDGNVLGEEVAAVYEPPTEEEPSHYAQGSLTIPAGTREAAIRFRLVLPQGGGERTFDVPVTIR
jgi:hypothetical protein